MACIVSLAGLSDLITLGKTAKLTIHAMSAMTRKYVISRIKNKRNIPEPGRKIFMRQQQIASGFGMIGIALRKNLLVSLKFSTFVSSQPSTCKSFMVLLLF